MLCKFKKIADCKYNGARFIHRYGMPLACLHLLGVLAFGQALNILNNGNFETGAMCYNLWIWSNTGQDYLGDYQFALSTDAHGGSYSAQITCTGTDCYRAAFFTDKIESPPSQSYQLTVYAKCPAGESASARIPYTTAGDYYQALTCNGDWARNDIFFTTPSTNTQFWIYLFKYGTGWVRFDDVVLKYADGTVPPSTVLHNGTRNVRISGQTLLVDDKPYLALGYFNVGYNDLAQAAATGANTVNGIYMNGSANCFNTYRQNYLDRAYELGLNFVPHSTSTAELQVPAVYANVIPAFAPHLANIAWFLADEPDQQAISWAYVPPTTLISSYQTIKGASTLPVMNDFQHAAWSIAADTQPYLGSSDIWMAEPYGPGFSTTVNAINNFNSIKRQPIWLAQDSIAPEVIVPKAYWMIINGAAGIVYFSWDDFKADPAKLAATSQVFTELTQLRNAIFASDTTSQMSVSSGIGATMRSLNGSTYLLSANPNAYFVTANFAVTGLQSGTPITVLFENRTIIASSGGFTDSFNGIARHVYVIPPPAAVTISSTPAGKSFSVTGAGCAAGSYTTPQTLNVWQGTSCTFSTTTPQAGSTGQQFVFKRWTDGGNTNNPRVIAIPNVSASSYNIEFDTQYQLSTTASPGSGGSLTPSNGSYFTSGTVVKLVATANGGYSFSGWNGSVSNAALANTTITLNAPQAVTANFTASTACQINSSAATSVVRTAITFNRTSGRYSQTLTVKNTSGASLTGPIYLAVQNLTSGVSLANSNGTTTCIQPSGLPLIEVAPNGMAVGGSASASLEFTNPSNGAISYSTIVLTGAGGQ